MPEMLPPEWIELRERTERLCEELRELEVGLEGAIDEPLRADVRRRAQQAGLWGMTQPHALGGSEAGPLPLTVVRETLARSNLRLSQLVLGPSPGVLADARGVLKERYLLPVVRGQKRGAWAMTEPAGAARPTFAQREGDELVITGHKAYVTGGAQADFYFVLLDVRPSAGEPGGRALVVVDRAAPGLDIEREFSSADGSAHVALSLERVRVPVDHVVGAIGQGMPRALGSIGETRLAMAAQASGFAMWAVDFVTRHVRRPHRSGTPLADREGVRLRLADMLLASYAARSVLYRTARLAESGEDVRNETMAAKVYCTEQVGFIVDRAIQLVGGQALVAAHPLEVMSRRVRAMRLAEGASDVLRINLSRGWLEFDAGRL